MYIRIKLFSLKEVQLLIYIEFNFKIIQKFQNMYMKIDVKVLLFFCSRMIVDSIMCVFFMILMIKYMFIESIFICLIVLLVKYIREIFYYDKFV